MPPALFASPANPSPTPAPLPAHPTHTNTPQHPFSGARLRCSAHDVCGRRPVPGQALCHDRPLQGTASGMPYTGSVQLLVLLAVAACVVAAQPSTRLLLLWHGLIAYRKTRSQHAMAAAWRQPNREPATPAPASRRRCGRASTRRRRACRPSPAALPPCSSLCGTAQLPTAARGGPWVRPWQGCACQRAMRLGSRQPALGGSHELWLGAAAGRRAARAATLLMLLM